MAMGLAPRPARRCPPALPPAPAPRWPPGRAGHLHAVVVGALPVEVAAVVVDAAVVQRAEAHEAVLQGVVTLLVHVVVTDHVLLAREPLRDSAAWVGASPPTSPRPLAPWLSRGVILPEVEAARVASRPPQGTGDGAIPKVPEAPPTPTLPWPPTRLPAVMPRSREAEAGPALQAGALMGDDSCCPGPPTGCASASSLVSKRDNPLCTYQRWF